FAAAMTMPCEPASTSAKGRSSGTASGFVRRIRSIGHAGSQTKTKRLITPLQTERGSLGRKRLRPAAFEIDCEPGSTGGVRIEGMGRAHRRADQLTGGR